MTVLLPHCRQRLSVQAAIPHWYQAPRPNSKAHALREAGVRGADKRQFYKTPLLKRFSNRYAKNET